ncbi:hypothetical protein TNIN_316942 [Trichonephila inaurata madagascariensis]|uniref:Uncharacterized protein n=1 Tax=Trichonephila inaurata madagascariensis TaxID=2747483 RepID=A0A8X7CRB5_9ARAC|nr:hypothetical protein TNIN_316942 [Trichonephila inaurata madagascariensis]
MLILMMRISFCVAALTVIGFCENLSLDENITHGNLEPSEITAEDAKNDRKDNSILNNKIQFRGISEAGSDSCLELKCDTPNTDCVYDVIKEKPVCMCKDENYMYVDNECKAMCEKDDDCENGGVCAGERT